MYRVNGVAKVVVKGLATLSEPFNVGPMAAGRLHNSSGGSVALTFHVSESKGGTYVLLVDDADASIGLTVADGKASALPAVLYEGSGYVKLVLASDAAAREFIVSQSA